MKFSNLKPGMIFQFDTTTMLDVRVTDVHIICGVRFRPAFKNNDDVIVIDRIVVTNAASRKPIKYETTYWPVNAHAYVGWMQLR